MRFRTCPVLAPPRHEARRQADCAAAFVCSTVGAILGFNGFDKTASDDQLEFCGLLDRQVGGLRTAENPCDVIGGPLEHHYKISPISHKPACSGPVLDNKHGWQSMCVCQLDDAVPMRQEGRAG